MLQLEQELKSNAYPGRGIVIGRSANGKYAVTAYFIMGRSANSRNRVFVSRGRGYPHPGFRPFQTGRSQSDHLCACTCPGQQDHRDQR